MAMKATRVTVAVVAILGTAGAGSNTTTIKSDVTFPDGYRNWRHVKSMVIEPGHALAGLVEGTHHIYANGLAMAGYGNRPFADGAVIVFDLLETKRGNQSIETGARKATIVMQRDRKRFPATDGWGYEVFAGGDRTRPQVGAKAAEMCHSCHVSQRSRDYVFSDYQP
jgi:hypothetical protein